MSAPLRSVVYFYFRYSEKRYKLPNNQASSQNRQESAKQNVWAMIRKNRLRKLQLLSTVGELCCPVSHLYYGMVRRLPSIGASNTLANINSGGRNMWINDWA